MATKNTQNMNAERRTKVEKIVTQLQALQADLQVIRDEAQEAVSKLEDADNSFDTLVGELEESIQQ